jgi:CheY-like chemotaxis protein/nitrogen-specific signal transduction histidine kinase
MHAKEKAAIELAKLAKQSESTKAKFLAQMSHEIRTPMNGVFGLLQLTYGEQNQQKMNDNLRTALRSFESLRRIIDDILDFSKIEANKLELVAQAFALDITLREVSQSMSRAAYGKHIDMWIDIDPACPRECVGDPIRLNQILFNLTNNAIKFTENGEIRLTIFLLDETENHYQLGIELSDTGIGMSPQESARIFDAFTQASDTTHGKFGGTGLGLAIVKQLVNLMDGSITVKSERNKGTSFVLDIYLQKSSKMERFSDPLTNDNSRNAEVFIVSTSELAHSILKKHCSSLGWLTRSFNTIAEVQESPLANNDNAKIMLVENKAQLSDEQIRQIKETKTSFPHLIVVHAGNPDFNRQVLNDDTLLDVVIDKPITPSELYDNLVPYTQMAGETNHKKESLMSTQLANAHILLVEDNDINQMVATSMLENAGAVVSVANNGQECLDMLSANEHTYQLILMDMQMPVMDGITATQEIRKLDKYAHLPIVALTANAMEEEVEACTNAGMQDHVAKPIDKSVLIQTVYKYL